MSLNESIVEDAAIEWFLLRQGYDAQVGEQCRITPPLIPDFSHREKAEDCAAILRLNFSIPEETLATDKESLLVQNISKGR